MLSELSVSRRTALTLGAAGAVGSTLGLAGFGRLRGGEAFVPLYSETVALERLNVRILVPQGRSSDVLPSSRVLVGAPDRDGLRGAELKWLHECADWTRQHDRWSSLLESALLDLRVLSYDLPCSVAGWTQAWRYAWPRDVAHVAVALSHAGHTEAALKQLLFMQEVQGSDGWFEARYDIETKKAPDERPRQFDGAAWMLWAASSIATQPGISIEAISQIREMVLRASTLLATTLGDRGLPPVSPDYWEVRASKLTLGIAAPVLAGLQHGAWLLTRLGEEAAANRSRIAADRLKSAISRQFGPTFPRDLGARKLDASIAFLFPPYALTPPEEDANRALVRAEYVLRRPAGGLAPGESWKNDGISWTPQTSLFAMVNAAIGDVAKAASFLGWIEQHRTSAGSIPEKVLHDGRPAAVAPLAWTAAMVVLAIAYIRAPDVLGQRMNQYHRWIESGQLRA